MNQLLKTTLFFASLTLFTLPVISIEESSGETKITKESSQVEDSESSNKKSKILNTEKKPLSDDQKNTSQESEKTPTQKSIKQSNNSLYNSKKPVDNVKNKDKKSKTFDPNETILKNPALTDEFKESYGDTNPMEHTLLNFFYGAISGGLIGLGGGLSFYTNSTDLTPLFISAGAVGAVGGITGVILALIESANKNQFQLSAGLFEYTWYGVFGGALIGGIVGLIPYSTTNNLASLLNWVGYGTFAGLGIGVAVYFIFPKKSFKNIIIDTNPLAPKIGYKFYF